MVFEAGATPAFFIFAVASWLVCRDVACVINPFRPQPLTGLRIGLAFVLAAIADGVQIMAGPLGWAGFDQAVDLVAMAITSYLLGFHFLLLPTFVLELVPKLAVNWRWKRQRSPRVSRRTVIARACLGSGTTAAIPTHRNSALLSMRRSSICRTRSSMAGIASR